MLRQGWHGDLNRKGKPILVVIENNETLVRMKSVSIKV